MLVVVIGAGLLGVTSAYFLSADGLPMIGATKVDNVCLNTGHGGLGLTQAAGSSQALADQIVGEPPKMASLDRNSVCSC